MDTPGSRTATKWIKPGQSLYPGDMIHNKGVYDKWPDYESPYWENQHMFAEGITFGDIFAKSGYPFKAFIYGSASSGVYGMQQARSFPEKILQHSTSLSESIDGDVPFITSVRLLEVLERELFASNVLAQNTRDQMTLARIAAGHLHRRNTEKDIYVFTPAQRQGVAKTFTGSHAMSRGTHFEDATWEMHFWGPALLMPETTHGIYHGDHAWSNNAALEKGIGLATQYGAEATVDARGGVGFDVIDILGRPVSVVDQAWEDARHLVYECTRPLIFKGQEYQIRSERAALLLISRFMYDEHYGTQRDFHNSGIDRDRVNDEVALHYMDVNQIERMDQLKSVMIPFLRDHCNWPTLQRMIDFDPDLKAYHKEFIVGAEAKQFPELSVDQYRAIILGYVPRGGYVNNDMRQLASVSADPPILRHAFSLPDAPNTPLGAVENGFDQEFSPKMYNLGLFERLGGQVPGEFVDPDHYNFEQAAAVATLFKMRHTGTPPFEVPHRVLYLDDPAGGYRAAAFRQDHEIGDLSELSTIYDSATQGGDKFSAAVAAETAAEMNARVMELQAHGDFRAWREEHGYGLVDSYAGISSLVAKYKGYREGTDTEAHKASAAKGSIHVSGMVPQAVAHRLTTMEGNGIVIPAGALTDTDCININAGLVSIVGKAPRPYSGGKYKMKFFMDFNPHAEGHLPPSAPVELDLADLIIHVGLQVKAMLEQPVPPKNVYHYVVLAQLLDVYERLKDPARRNSVIDRDCFDGSNSENRIIDFSQVDPEFIKTIQYLDGMPAGTFDESILSKGSHNPALDAFLEDEEYRFFSQPEINDPKDPDFKARQDFYRTMMANPVAKAKLADMIWGHMRAAPNVLDNGQNWIVSGRLSRVADYFDAHYLNDLHPDYKSARDSLMTMSARDRTALFRVGQAHVARPEVLVR